MSSTNIFHQAIINPDFETIKRILKHESWAPTNDEGETILHLAFKRKNQSIFNQKVIIQILECFMDEGISINLKNAAGETVLFLAVKNRLRLVIDYLVQHGANVNVQDQKGNSIVHTLIEDQSKKYPKDASIDLLVFVEEIDINFMTWLLSKGVNVDCRNNEGKTAFILAVERDLNHVLPILVKHMIDVNHFDEDGCTIIQSFFKARLNTKSDWPYKLSQDIEIVNYFLDKGVSVDHVDKKGNTPLHTYLKSFSRNPKMMRCMMQRYTKVNTQDHDGNTVLHLIIKNSFFDSHRKQQQGISAIHTLLSKGANANLKNHAGENLVRFAFQVKLLKLLEVLLHHGADVSPSPNSGAHFLHDISSVPRTQDEMWSPMIDTLVQAGWNVNQVRPANQFTPLMVACKFTRPAIAQKLIDNGADVNYVERHYLMRPIHVAAKYSVANYCTKTVALFEMLAKAGANVNAKNIFGKTALHLVTHSRYDAVRRLLRLGANVDAKDKKGRLPLHEATKKGNVEVIKILLAFGAEVNDVVVLKEMNQIMIEPVDNEVEIIHGANVNNVIQGKRAAIDCLTQQWLRLKAANLPVMEGFAEFTKKEYLQQYYIECLAEVEMLKKHRINDRTTLYDLLHMDVNLRYIFIVKELKNLANSPLLKNQFPKYHYLITGHYNKANARYPLIKPALRAWDDLTDIRLPDCIERIFIFLDNEDLRLMARKERKRKSLKRSAQTTEDELAKRMRLKLKELVKSPLLATAYPIYRIVIEAHYHKALARSPLIEPARRAWDYLTGIRLPDCVEPILAYLENEDLRVMAGEEEEVKS